MLLAHRARVKFERGALLLPDDSVTGELGEWLEVTQGKLQATVFGMLVLSNSKGDVDVIPRQQGRLLKALSHMPA